MVETIGLNSVCQEPSILSLSANFTNQWIEDGGDQIDAYLRTFNVTLTIGTERLLSNQIANCFKWACMAGLSAWTSLGCPNFSNIPDTIRDAHFRAFHHGLLSRTSPGSWVWSTRFDNSINISCIHSAKTEGWVMIQGAVWTCRGVLSNNVKIPLIIIIPQNKTKTSWRLCDKHVQQK